MDDSESMQSCEVNDVEHFTRNECTTEIFQSAVMPISTHKKIMDVKITDALLPQADVT